MEMYMLVHGIWTWFMKIGKLWLKMITKGFSYTSKIAVATILQSLMVIIGFMLLVLPGIYLMVAYQMTLPLIVDQGMSPWQAMEKSRKGLHKIWWKVAGLMLIMSLLYVATILTLGIAMIWILPLHIILVGVVYKYLFLNK